MNEATTPRDAEVPGAEDTQKIEATRSARNLIVPGVVGMFALGGGFLLGPRPEVDTTLRPIEVPAAPGLVEWLAASEAAVGDVQPFATKAIRWFHPDSRDRTPISLVYLHGFSATRQEIAPVPDLVATSLGANLFYTRLTGHGQENPDALAEASVNDWLHDAIEALEVGRRLGDHVVVMGTSTGATLATWLASERPDDIDGLVFLSPNYRLRDPKSVALGWPWGNQLVRWLLCPRRSFEPSNDLQDLYWTTDYPTQSLVTLAGLMQLADQVSGDAVRTPLLMLVDPEDQVISAEVAEERFAGFATETKRLVHFESGDPSHHVLTGDALSPATNEAAAREIYDFIAGLPFATGLEVSG